MVPATHLPSWKSVKSNHYAFKKTAKGSPGLTFDPVFGCGCLQMQGAGTKSWNKLSALFNKEDEHQLLEETESPPVADQWVKNLKSDFTLTD